ncbi:MAG: response regulator [Flavobacteriia bacterium]|jgi:DNA-binding NtrC family response regulator
MNQDVNLLVVEDETVYSRIIMYQLSKLEIPGKKLHVHLVTSIAEMQEFKEFLNPDIVLLDLGLPDSQGTETFKLSKEIYPESAIIILTGNNDEAMASRLVSSGAQDFLFKADADTKVLGKTIDYALDRMNYQRELIELSDKPIISDHGSSNPIVVTITEEIDALIAGSAEMFHSDIQEALKRIKALVAQIP